MSYQSTILADSPVGYWRHGESAGTNMNDVSGGFHVGTYSAVTLGGSGALVGDAGTSGVYNGSSSHADVSYAAWMDVTTAFSIEAWIKTTATGLHSICDRDHNASRVHQFRINSGSLEFVKIAGGVVTASEPATINNGAWQYVTATYDGANIRLYKAGALLGSPHAATGSLAGTDAISVGANVSAGYNSFFNGQIEELAYYNSVLTPTQIAAHYTAGITAGAGAITGTWGMAS